MSPITHEATTADAIVTTAGPAPEFSQEYSQGKLEEMGSRELLARYAE